jgi:hypothetical protein
MEGEISGKARRGAPNKSHRTQRKECLQRKGISLVDWKDLAQNKNAWRILIKNESILPYKQNRMYSTYEKNPHTAIRRQVEKRFKGKYFMGVVFDTDFDTDTNETIWAVRYDDGDVEDLNAKELAAVLYDNGAGITTSNANTQHGPVKISAPHDHTPERKRPFGGPFSFQPALGGGPIDTKMVWRGFVLW